MRRSFALGLLSVATAFCQEPIKAPAFDVASVKPLPNGAGNGDRARGRENIKPTPSSVSMSNVSMRSAVRWAYHVTEYQVVGPDWIDTQRFDIVAKAASQVDEDTLRVMMQTLLAERFKMTQHRQTKEMQAYVLTIAKGGVKFHESKSEGESVIQPDEKTFTVTIERTPLSQMIDMLAPLLRAPILDETGLKARYDISINLMKYVNEMKGGDMGDPISMVTMAMQSELGLKMEGRKTAVDLVVIDHVEKTPVEN